MGKRIQKLIDQMPSLPRVIDVGTDHGYVALGLAWRSDIDRVLATDLRPQALAKLEGTLVQLRRGNARERAVADKIQTAVADGLKDLPWKDCEGIVISGMGGSLMTRILREGLERLPSVRVLVLSPQKNVEEFRHTLVELGGRIEEELVEEEGKFYDIFRLFLDRPADVAYAKALENPLFAQYGPLLLEKQHPLLRKKLERDRRKLMAIQESWEESAPSGGRGNPAFQRILRQQEEIDRLLFEFTKKEKGFGENAKERKEL